MRIEILSTVVFLSLLHGLVPSHWAPVMGLKKQHGWTLEKTIRIVAVISVAHILSTVIIGVIVAIVGYYAANFLLPVFSIKVFSSVILFLLGVYFIYRHAYHHHFHLYHEEALMKQNVVNKQIRLLILAMFFSPCMEITGMYFVGGVLKGQYIVVISLIYFIISFLSSLFWIFFFDILAEKINFHKLEHNSGLMSGLSLIVSAFLVYVI